MRFHHKQLWSLILKCPGKPRIWHNFRKPAQTWLTFLSRLQSPMQLICRPTQMQFKCFLILGFKVGGNELPGAAQYPIPRSPGDGVIQVSCGSIAVALCQQSQRHESCAHIYLAQFKVELITLNNNEVMKCAAQAHRIA